MEGDCSTAQQIIAVLVEGVLSQLALSHASQTQRNIFAESTTVAVFHGNCVKLPVKQCVELCAAVFSAAVYLYSIVQRLRQ